MKETVSTLSASETMRPEKRGYIFRDTALVISRTTTNRCIVGMLYLFVKFLFCVNLLAQFIFLTVVVKDRIGIEANATEILSCNETTVPAFPRNVLCDIHIKHFENIQSYTLTCDLVINDEFEKFYVVLWFWVLAVFLVSAVNFMMWFACLFVACVRTSRITSYVTAFNRDAHRTKLKYTLTQQNHELSAKGLPWRKEHGKNTAYNRTSALLMTHQERILA
ncbi:innexin-19-like [Gigantopelta aegis]|uniref:innexin-19-like n=1 Tax=Gigantopelta aegis TaxID=1735272 RepID=UPI001B8893E2|nr:innexin-19-like [Gigantopelta aegis]